ncbi:MAG: hypothetical protein Q8P07_01225 [bacterium]|nr:hypothetical protein [bacterium]
MNQKGFANIVLIVLIIVVGGGAGFFYWSKRMTPAEQVQTADTPPQQILPSANNVSSQTPTSPPKPISNTQPTPAPATGETVNWKIYRNEKYGFEIKYPQDWKAAELTDYEKLAEFRFALLPASTPPPQSAKMSINVMDRQQADVFLSRFNEIKAIWIGGIEGKRGSLSNPKPDDTFMITLPSKTLSANQTFYITGVVKYSETVDKILATFRFTR